MTIDEYLDLVKDALEALPELAGIGVVVDNQQDIEALQAKALAKSKGYAVMIGEVSNRIFDKDIDGPEVKLKFGVTVYSPKIIRDGGVTGSSLRDVIMRRLHQSKLQVSQHCYDEALYVDGKVFDEKDGTHARMIHAMAYESPIFYTRHPDLEE